MMFDKETLKQLIESEWLKATIDGSYAPPLFHGTNRNALYMAVDERSKLNDACVCIQEYLLKISDANGCDATHFGSKDASGDEYEAIKQAAYTAYSRRNGSNGYSYGDLYMTNNPDRAVSYASRAVVLGETGFQTWWLYEGVKRMGYKMPPRRREEEAAFQLFTEYATKKDEPVILMKCGLSTETMRDETGEIIDGKIPLPSEETLSYMYPVEIDLTKWEKITVEEAKAIWEKTEELSPSLRNAELRYFNNRTVRITDVYGKTEEGPCVWISKTQCQQVIAAKGMQDNMDAEECVVVQSLFPRSDIYKIECISEWQPPYKNWQCISDESKKRGIVLRENT